MYLRCFLHLPRINCISISNVRLCSTVTEKSNDSVNQSSKTSTYEELKYVKPPNYVNTFPAYEPKNILQEEYMPEANKTGFGPRLADYLAIQNIVQSLKTPQEKIDFVNPYEREWTRVEKKWHRKWHPDLYSTRKAWALPPVPKYFDCLSYYQYITKMRLINDENIFNDIFKNLVLPTETFEKKVIESLTSYIFSESCDTDKQRTDKFLRSLLYDAQSCLASSRQHLRNLRISNTERIESFWIRGGFSHLYEWQPIWAKEPITDRRKIAKFIGDDRRKLGELAFTMRDEVAVNVRQEKPMKEIFPLDNHSIVEAPIFDEDVDLRDICYSPKVFNLWPDGDPLWQCPGYEYDCGETHKYGRVAFKNTLDVVNRLDYWNISGDNDKVKTDIYNSIAISSLFNWLNSQAHCDGFTQYTDIKYPYVSNMIMSDGNDFTFATGQLNTIAINIDNPDFINNKTNACFVDGPYKLYDDYDSETDTFYHSNSKGEQEKGLNKHVLLRILQLVVKE
uniref:28S ribosomal protein S30, mitochondrial n=1 Tax=Parastrongyloides trichosuri TaxID=131310 RepID=A0A0N4ZN34_PARTI